MLVQPPTHTQGVAALLFVGGLTIGGLALVFRTHSDPLKLVFAGTAAVVSIFGAVIVAGSAETITVTLDRTADLVRVERRSRSGPSVRTAAVSAVEDVVLQESVLDNDTTYRLVLRLTGGRSFPLTWSSDGFRVPEKRAAVEAIRRFLGRAATNDR